MELDKRFKVLPFCCFGTEKKVVTNHIGKKGYFANDIDFFKSIDLCEYGTLEKIYCDEAKSFQMREKTTSFRFFIPECFVKPKEKQYRPFTLNEFLHIYELGDIVTFRCKYNDHRYAGIVTGYETDKEGDKAIIHIGCYSYLLSVLFTDYERINSEEGKWVPFGVEVEE